MSIIDLKFILARCHTPAFLQKEMASSAILLVIGFFIAVPFALSAKLPHYSWRNRGHSPILSSGQEASPRKGGLDVTLHRVVSILVVKEGRFGAPTGGGEGGIISFLSPLYHDPPGEVASRQEPPIPYPGKRSFETSRGDPVPD